MTTQQLPGARQKVIGLVSGGKDSCFNLVHCVANGHDIVAIATLQPEPGIDELDSHLYQSVGTQLLPLIAESMGVPLYTGLIKGKAVERGPEYGDRTQAGDGIDGDETEDLTKLLRRVQEAHPEATALASGAILSNYQRIRIEHVCGRLGLISLSYLWQQPQTPLLESMFRSGLKPILVKVAGVGLGVDLVGRDLESTMPALRKLERMYGSHPAGEGGEYETITLDSPLFSHRLKIVESEVVVTDPEPYPVAYLRVGNAVLEEKEGWVCPTVGELRAMLGLDEEAGEEGLDEGGKDVMRDVLGVEISQEGVETEEMGGLTLSDDAGNADSSVRFSRRGRWFAASVNGKTEGDEDVGAELRRCFDQITSELDSRDLSLPLHAAHITLLLSSMDLFLPANNVYKTYFGSSPPSRATVAVPLPAGQRVRIEVTGFDDTLAGTSAVPGLSNGQRKIGGRQALHVQGLSYWAPANIGPYSQAVIVNERVHIAGQIPLIPASLTLPLCPSDPETSAYPHQAALALQHVGRIVDVLKSKNSTGGGWTGWGESCVGWWARGPGQGQEGLEVVRKAWAAWAQQNGWEDVPVLFVRARELPKGALVEYQTCLHTGRRAPRGDTAGDDAEAADNEDDDEELEVDYTRAMEGGVWWEQCITSGSAKSGRAIVFGRDASLDAAGVQAELSGLLRAAVSVKAYHRASLGQEQLSRLGQLLKRDGAAALCVTYVPVLEVHDREGEAAEWAMEVFYA